MRVLYVGRSRGVHDQRFADAWSAAGAEVTVLAVDEVEAGHSGAAFEAVLGRTLSETAPDLVQVGPLTWPGALVAEMWQGALIATSWGFDLMHDIDTDDVALNQARTTLARADLVFVDNSGPERRARELGAVAIVSFPWGIDGAQFSRGAVERDPYRVVSVRRHEALYRADDVLAAFALAAPSEPRLSLVMGGAGSLTPALQTLADELGISGRVSWPGELGSAALADLFASSGLYVSTSRVDGSSISLLEAMASGIPVAVADIEGNRDWVDDSTGWRFAVGDVASLAGLMVALPGDPTVTARTAEAAQRVARSADWQSTVARFGEFAAAALAASSVREKGRA